MSEDEKQIGAEEQFGAEKQVNTEKQAGAEFFGGHSSPLHPLALFVVKTSLSHSIKFFTYQAINHYVYRIKKK